MSQTDDLRINARLLFDAAVKAADPALAVRRGLTQSPVPLPSPKSRTFLIAVGKAAPAMLGEAMIAFPDAHAALAVTHHENEANVQGAELLRAGHPVPDEAGARAAQRVMALLSDATENDRIVALISGGGSALLPAPPSGVSLTDKALIVLNHFCVELVIYGGFAALLSTPPARAGYLRLKPVIDRGAALILGALGLRLLSGR